MKSKYVKFLTPYCHSLHNVLSHGELTKSHKVVSLTAHLILLDREFTVFLETSSVLRTD